MATETEVKMKVDDHEPIRAQLRDLGATRVGLRFEINQFFDSPELTLKAKDQGLRLRSMKHDDGSESSVITFKGPATQTQVKSREEIEFSIGSFADASLLLARLGYTPTLGFEKRRETWALSDCLVELDELPHLGLFVEIEGDTQELVLSVRTMLGMDASPLITKGYIRMVDELVRGAPHLGPRVGF